MLQDSSRTPDHPSLHGLRVAATGTPPDPAFHDPAPEITPTEARGAEPVNRVRWVLIIGIPAAILVMWIAYMGITP